MATKDSNSTEQARAKKAEKAKERGKDIPAFNDPEQFLAVCMNDKSLLPSMRVDCAKALLQAQLKREAAGSYRSKNPGVGRKEYLNRQAEQLKDGGKWGELIAIDSVKKEDKH